MAKRYCGSVVPKATVEGEPETALKTLAEQTSPEVLKLYDGMQFHMGLDKAFTFIRGINRYAEQRAPWKLAKSEDAADRQALETTMANMAEALRIAAVLITPIMPTVSEKILSLLSQPRADLYEGLTGWSSVLEGKTLGAPEILFPRPQQSE